MTTSLRIMAVLLGLLGVERIVYADVVAVLPQMAEPTPALSAAIGLAILVFATGLFLGFGWSRWPSALGATFVMLQGIAYVAWNLGRGIGPIGVVLGLLEPALALLIIERLVRRWPAGVPCNDRLR
jgi:hypothetical protein